MTVKEKMKIDAISTAIKKHICQKSNPIFSPADYATWHIGVTNSSSISEAQNAMREDMFSARFEAWDTASIAVAEEIRILFNQLGMRCMRSTTPTKRASTLVYVFKVSSEVPTTLLSILE